MGKKYQKIIEKIRKKLVEGYKPEKIILFGSFAWGRPKKDSDFDLLLIKKTKENPYYRIPRARSFLYDIDEAFDILVMTPKEVGKRLKLGDFFIQEIFKKGKILYEAKK